MADPIKIEFLVERILADLLDTDLIAVDVPSGDTHKINLGQLISYISANGGFVDLTSDQTIGGVKTFSRDNAPAVIIRSLAATGTRIKFEGDDPTTGVYLGRYPGSLGDFSVTIAGNSNLTAYDLLVNSTGNVYGRVNATQATNENSLVRLGHLNTQLNSQTPNKPVDLGTSDLDTILTPGFYFQTTGTNATPERNYPVASAGSLTVLNGNGATGYIEQIFFPINQPGYWIRTQVNGVWGAWLDISASQGGGGGVWGAITGDISTQTDLITITNANAAAAAAAQGTANTANSTANTALTNAATADGKAVAAQGTADTAVANAATAQGTADTANSTANTALTNAATADGKAVAAQGTANTANSTANTALTNAATADSKAVAAQATADSALAANAWTLRGSGYADSNGDSITSSVALNTVNEVMLIFRKDSGTGRVDTTTSYPGALMIAGSEFEEGGIGGSSYITFELTSTTVITCTGGTTGARGIANIYTR